MQKLLSAWLRIMLLALSASISLGTIAAAQEQMRESCQGDCGEISCCPQDCCAGDCCYPRTTARLEYLMWWGRGQNIPALVTTSPNGTPQNEAGDLGFANTTTLFGDQSIQQRLRSGGRITLNHELCSGDILGGRFWGLEQGRTNFSRASDGDPILARPFFNNQLPGEDALLVAFPGVTTDGSVNVRTGNQILGADAWFRRSLARDACFQLDWLAGYQFVRMNDSIFIRDRETDISGGVVPIGTVISTADNFRTSSEFHGGTLGFVVDNRYGQWQLDLLAKIALGNMHETVNVSGLTTITEPGLAPSTRAGGLLAQGTNSGVRSRNRFTYIPEINLNLGCHLNDQWTFTVGYSFLYFSNVAVAGGQIDRAVNLSQNPGPLVGSTRPAPLLNSTDYWVQGLSLGMDYRF